MKPKFKNDFILIGVVLAVAIILFIILKLTAKTGDTVEIAVNGKVIKSFNLSDDIRYEIKTDSGNINTLVIKENKAYIEYANCRDKICQNHAPINHEGDSIICLPHKVTITVCEGDE